MATEGKLLGRAELKGVIRLDTGLHIGRSRDTLEIGGIDNPIIRDPFSQQPYIPGSSLKGKMRSFAEKVLVSRAEKDVDDYAFDSLSTVGGDTKIYRHECPTADLAKHCPVCRLFGSTGNSDTLGRYQDRKKIPKEGREDNTSNFPATSCEQSGIMTQPPGRLITIGLTQLSEKSLVGADCSRDNREYNSLPRCYSSSGA